MAEMYLEQYKWDVLKMDVEGVAVCSGGLYF